MIRVLGIHDNFSVFTDHQNTSELTALHRIFSPYMNPSWFFPPGLVKAMHDDHDRFVSILWSQIIEREDLYTLQEDFRRHFHSSVVSMSVGDTLIAVVIDDHEIQGCFTPKKPMERLLGQVCSEVSSLEGNVFLVSTGCRSISRWEKSIGWVSAIDEVELGLQAWLESYPHLNNSTSCTFLQNISAFLENTFRQGSQSDISLTADEYAELLEHCLLRARFPMTPTPSNHRVIALSRHFIDEHRGLQKSLSNLGKRQLLRIFRQRTKKRRFVRMIAEELGWNVVTVDQLRTSPDAEEELMVPLVSYLDETVAAGWPVDDISDFEPRYRELFLWFSHKWDLEGRPRANPGQWEQAVKVARIRMQNESHCEYRKLLAEPTLNLLK
ncbi:hypothetical protein VKT23_014205 [Stygiomarasmius scandens]|uniref:Uncharacterized protein n=1 Tax=Marasmiellus scandens TaxID=2682957 RepID=A0ABR1J142_9AGAR